MKSFPTAEELRKSAEIFYRKEKKPNPKGTLALFVKYMEAYCAELNKTEWDVLRDEETWESVYSIFLHICGNNLATSENIPNLA
jgi:hypothetical protein